MYKIYFDNRFINIFAQEDNKSLSSEQIIFCKNIKSFDNAYQLFINDFSISKLNIECAAPKLFFRHLENNFKQIKAAGGVVLNQKGELLVIKRHGIWDLPKGKIEKGEKKKIAALREVEEECGISNLSILSKIGKTYHTYKMNERFMLKTTFWYKMFYSGNEDLVPQVEESITEVRWMKKGEIEKAVNNTYESLKIIFKDFLKQN